MLQVTHGDSPVINALIAVNITVRMNNGSVALANNLTMLDNGYGGKGHGRVTGVTPAGHLNCYENTSLAKPFILLSVITIENLESLLPPTSWRNRHA